MKTLKYITILSIAILISSCSITKKVEKSIVGKWQITSLKLEKESALSDTFNKTVNDLIKDSYIDFRADKTYDFNLANEVKTGTWHISEDRKKILFSKNETFFKIISLTDNILTLESFKKTKTALMILKKI